MDIPEADRGDAVPAELSMRFVAFLCSLLIFATPATAATSAALKPLEQQLTKAWLNLGMAKDISCEAKRLSRCISVEQD